MKRFQTILTASAVFASLALAACNSKDAELEIEPVGDTMAYNKTSLEVPAGAKVKLTFKNIATSPAMQHNWVLTKPGKDVEVATAGMSAGPDKGFIPDSPEIIAHTKLLKPGESDTITFTAPAAGDYPYECTFPGHYVMMKGVLHVK